MCICCIYDPKRCHNPVRPRTLLNHPKPQLLNSVAPLKAAPTPRRRHEELREELRPTEGPLRTIPPSFTPAASMNNKLTLCVSEALIASAKDSAAAHGRPVLRTVATQTA